VQPEDEEPGLYGLYGYRSLRAEVELASAIPSVSTGLVFREGGAIMYASDSPWRWLQAHIHQLFAAA
jgi:hypothetical protein